MNTLDQCKKMAVEHFDENMQKIMTNAGFNVKEKIGRRLLETHRDTFKLGWDCAMIAIQELSNNNEKDGTKSATPTGSAGTTTTLN